MDANRNPIHVYLHVNRHTDIAARTNNPDSLPAVDLGHATLLCTDVDKVNDLIDALGQARIALIAREFAAAVLA